MYDLFYKRIGDIIFKIMDVPPTHTHSLSLSLFMFMCHLSNGGGFYLYR